MHTYAWKIIFKYATKFSCLWTFPYNNPNKNILNKLKLERVTSQTLNKYRDYPVSENYSECVICCRTTQ